MSTTREPGTAPEADTRTRILRAAAHLFARKGIDGVKIQEINALAGQRNESAVHYHFGNRWNLVGAILEEHDVTTIGDLDAPPEEVSDPESVVIFLARLLGTGLQTAEGRDWLRIVAELMGRFRGGGTAAGWTDRLTPVTELLQEQLPSMSRETVARRAVIMLGFMTSQMADRAREIDDAGGASRSEEEFLDEIISISLAMLLAPERLPGGRPGGKRLLWRQRPGQPSQG